MIGLTVIYYVLTELWSAAGVPQRLAQRLLCGAAVKQQRPDVGARAAGPAHHVPGLLCQGDSPVLSAMCRFLIMAEQDQPGVDGLPRELVATCFRR